MPTGTPYVAGSNFSNTAATTLAVTLSGVAAGHFLVAIFALNSSTGPTADPATAQGWTAQGTFLANGTTLGSRIYTKLAGAGEANPSWTFASGKPAAFVVGVSGADQVTPVDVAQPTPTQTTTAATTSAAPPSITPATTDTTYLTLVAARTSGTTAGHTFTAPATPATTLVGQVTEGNTTAINIGAAAAYRLVSGTSAQTETGWTDAQSSTFNVYSFLVRSAAAAAAPFRTLMGVGV